MFKSVLASLTGSPSDTTVLETAGQVATSFKAHVDCLHVKFDVGDPGNATAFETAGFNARVMEQLRAMDKRIQEHAARAHAAFEEVRKAKNLAIIENGSGAANEPSVAYQEVTGVDLDATLNQARLHDLAIVAHDARYVIDVPDRAGSIMLRSGRPVLVPTRKASKTLGTRVVVAWKDTREAARAVGAALPFLQKAEAVHILGVSEESLSEGAAKQIDELARQLRWHGVQAKTKTLPYSLTPPVERLLDEAYKLDADLLVMGGYGHSRFSELVFGGMTREVLKGCEVPLLLAH